VNPLSETVGILTVYRSLKRSFGAGIREQNAEGAEEIPAEDAEGSQRFIRLR
jgi:hypothetical protein